MRIRLEIGILVFSLFACTDQTSQPLAADPYERWRSYSLHDYTIDQIRTCYCLNGGLAVRITVRSDTIALVMRLSDMTTVSISESKWYLSVDSLFGTIRTSKTDSLVVSYNSQYGYPETLDINPQLHPVDGGVLYQTSNLQVR
ncbi:MAG: DUF6174 domain-containing protein [Bacteroidota bacterium]